MRVLVTSVGSSPGLDMVRSLALDPTITVVGADASDIGRRYGARHCHEVVALPRADHGVQAYADALDALAATVDAVFVGLDIECEALSEAGRKPANAFAVPDPELLPALLDKAETAKRSGLPALFPETRVFQGADDCEVVGSFDGPVWMRPCVGTSGQGSLCVQDVDEARAWLIFQAKRGVHGPWMAQSFLPGRNLNWTGLYRGGVLVAQAAMERVEYYLATVAVSGITGQVRRCRTVDPNALSPIGDQVVRSLTDAPSGVFSVDLREDDQGVATVTEINPRMAGRPWLFTHAGVNLPLVACRAFLGLPIGDAVAPGGLRLGVEMVRQLDEAPVFIEP